MAKGQSSSRRWGSAEEDFLRGLFERTVQEGGVDFRDRTNDNIKRVHQEHFSSCPYRSFAQLFRRKALAWETERNLAGRRREEGGVKPTPEQPKLEAVVEAEEVGEYFFLSIYFSKIEYSNYNLLIFYFNQNRRRLRNRK